MTGLDELLRHLVDAFVDHADTRSDDGRLVVTALDLDLPVEARLGADGYVLATLPRGRLATGFELPLGRLRVHCREPGS